MGPASAGVLIHEIGHLIRDHATRARDLPGRYNHPAWNIATDAALNDDLITAGIPLPDGAITPHAFGLPTQGIEETYYTHLTANQPPTPTPTPDNDPNTNHDDNHDGDSDVDPVVDPGVDPVDGLDDGGGCGSGAGGPAPCWEIDANDPTAPVRTPGQADIVRRLVATDIRDHTNTTNSTGQGTIPGGWQNWAHQQLAPPTIAWRTILASAIRRALATTAGRTTYTYTRSGRRQLPNIITPAMRSPRLHITTVLWG